MKPLNFYTSHVTIKTLLLLVSFLLVQYTFGQKKEANELKTRAFHVSLITPLSTNGLESANIINNVSINLLAGYSGGLNGVEFSGLASILEHDMVGVRFTGFANVTLGSTEGADFAGFFNYANKQTKGAQFAGFANVITQETMGGQVAGFANITKGSMDGVQLAGFANVVDGEAALFQASGFANTSTGNIDGAQISGFANYAKGGKNGQLTGFCNVTSDSIEGVQIAGFSNISGKRLDGFQLAGFVNYAKRLNGIQIAPFNVVDSLEKGTPIGVLSFVKNGYRAIGLSANESQYFNVHLKTGTNAFYTFLTSGIGSHNQMLLWHYGFGAGTTMSINEKVNLSFELQSSHVNEDEWYTPIFNLHNKLTAATSFKLNSNISIIGGLSWNVIVSDTKDDYGSSWETSAAPYTIFDKTYNRTNVKMYPGISIGIEFN